MAFSDPAPKRGVALASLARTATTQSSVINVPRGYRGVRVYIDVTAVSATPSVVFSIQKKDNVSSDWGDLLASAAVTAATTGPTFLEVYPGIGTTANRSLGAHIGDSFRIGYTAGDADSMTASVGYELLP